MFYQFENLRELMTALEDDRRAGGAGASTRDRFPVRLVLFDNFRDCCAFIEELQNQIQLDPISIE